MSLQINDNDSLFNAFQLTRDQAVKRLKEHSEDGSGIFINEIKRGKSTYYIQAETTYRGNNFFTRGLSKFFGIKRTEITLQGIDPITKQRFEIAKGTFNNGEGVNKFMRLIELTNQGTLHRSCSFQAELLKNKANEFIQTAQSDPYKDQKVALLNQLSSQFSTIANTIISTAFNKTEDIPQLKKLTNDIIRNLNSSLSKGLIDPSAKTGMLKKVLNSFQTIKKSIQENPNLTQEKKKEYINDLQSPIDILTSSYMESRIPTDLSEKQRDIYIKCDNLINRFMDPYEAALKDPSVSHERVNILEQSLSQMYAPASDTLELMSPSRIQKNKTGKYEIKGSFDRQFNNYRQGNSCAYQIIKGMNLGTNNKLITLEEKQDFLETMIPVYKACIENFQTSQATDEDKAKAIKMMQSQIDEMQDELRRTEIQISCSNLARSLTNKAQIAANNDMLIMKTSPLAQISTNLGVIANIINPEKAITSFSTGEMSRDIKNETSGKTLADGINKDLDLALSQKLITQEEKQEILETAISGLQAGIETLKKLNLSSDKESDYTNALKHRIDTLQTELENSKEFNELNDSLKNAKTVSEFAKTFSKLRTTDKFIENLQKSKDEKALKKEKDLSPIYSKCGNWAKTLTQATSLSNEATNLSPEERESIIKVCGAVTKELGVAKNTIDPSLPCSEIIRDIKNEMNKKPTLANRIINSLNSALELGFITTEERQEILQDALSAIKEGINTEKDPKYSPSQDMPKFRDHLTKQAKILQDELNKTQKNANSTATDALQHSTKNTNKTA